MPQKLIDMKSNFKLLLMLYALLSLCSCSEILSSNGNSFIGTWKQKENYPRKISISKEGDHFIVSYYGFIYPAYEQSFVTSAQLKNGSLELERNNDFPGRFSTSISYSSNEIFYNGEYYKKIK